MAKSVFEQIKKQNGERFAKAIRGYDNGIFDVPGIVDIVKYAGHESEPVMEYLESLKALHIEETGAYQDPLILLDAAGYDAYYVTNLEEQNRIQKYYADGEKLCTFRDPHRFENYHIVNAVKKNVDQIRRADFKGKEQREDEYGTSVISIQILKTGGFISIKNRYNHTVDNPDNTFFSDPDRIIPGLANSLRHHFETDFSTRTAQLPNNYTFINNQIIRHNYEQNNIYFGSDFYVKDGVVHSLESHEMMLDTYIFDMRTKTLRYPNTEDNSEEDSSFKEAFLKEIEGHKVILKKDKEGHHLFIRKEGEKDPTQDTEILTVKDGAITAINFPTVTEIGDFFLLSNKFLKSFTAPNLTTVGTHFLGGLKNIQKLDIPKLETAGNNFLHRAEDLTTFSAPSLREVGDYFLYSCNHLQQIEVPNIKTVGNNFLAEASRLQTLDMPNLETARYEFLGNTPELTRFSAPKLKSVGSSCLQMAIKLQELSLPELVEADHYFLENCKELTSLHLPKLRKTGTYFLRQNQSLRRVEFPELTGIEDNTLSHTRDFEFFSAPKAKYVLNGFLSSCESPVELNLPAVEHIGKDCLSKNIGSDISLPSVKTIGNNFMSYATLSSSFSAPQLETLGSAAFFFNKELKTFYAPCLKKCPDGFLFQHPNREAIWESRTQLPASKEDDLPKEIPIDVDLDEPILGGISGVLRTAEVDRQEPTVAASKPESQKGISARLTQAEQAKADNPSFFKKLRDWFLPQK